MSGVWGKGAEWDNETAKKVKEYESGRVQERKRREFVALDRQSLRLGESSVFSYQLSVFGKDKPKNEEKKLRGDRASEPTLTNQGWGTLKYISGWREGNKPKRDRSTPAKRTGRTNRAAKAG
jgi:hypothetical protein